jgi:ferric iron reductase protein FhuF
VTSIVEGAPAVEALASALDRVTALVPYLSAPVDPHGAAITPPSPGSERVVPADGVWLSCQDLIDDPAWLGDIVRATGVGVGTDDPVVAASVFVQSYSYRVLALTVACLVSSGVVPDASAPQMVVGLARSWPSLFAFHHPRVLVVDATPDMAQLPGDTPSMTDALRFVIDRSIDRHLGPLIEAVRAGIGVPMGERLLWGNVAASAAVAFRTMEGALGSFVEPLGERFFVLAPPPLHGLGSFWVIDDGGRRGWFWERTNCCLFDRLPDGIRCADCSRTPVAERRQAYRDSLDPSGGTTPAG